MKVTVEISDLELRDVLRFTGERKKGPAIHKMVADALMLCRRREGTNRILSGQWRMKLPSWSEARVHERGNNPDCSVGLRPPNTGGQRPPPQMHHGA